MSLITVDDAGLCCRAGDFWIDPWRPVSRAIITHAHADHARPGSSAYVCSGATEPFLRHRLGADIAVTPLRWGEAVPMGRCTVSLHPAGHCAGSAQIRIEGEDEVWVVTGDYKRAEDPSCEPFEPLPCDALVTEATFALPVYRWEDGGATAARILRWWRCEVDAASLLFCYAFGKTQRVLAELFRIPAARELARERGVYLHGAATRLTDLYRSAGYELLPTRPIPSAAAGDQYRGALVIAPPSAHRSPWMRRFHMPRTAFASGWMLVRGARRRRGYERGFALSDHADWPALVRTVRESGASRVYVTHGHNDVLSRYLQEELAVDAHPLSTLYDGETSG